MSQYLGILRYFLFLIIFKEKKKKNGDEGGVSLDFYQIVLDFHWKRSSGLFEFSVQPKKDLAFHLCHQSSASIKWHR